MADDSERASPQYWLPAWWGWMQDWSKCISCLEYNHTPCASCEIPPGLLGIVCLVGGGTATVTGNMRGNVGIANHAQAQESARVNRHLQHQQQININVKSNVNQNKIRRNRNGR